MAWVNVSWHPARFLYAFHAQLPRTGAPDPLNNDALSLQEQNTDCQNSPQNKGIRRQVDRRRCQLVTHSPEEGFVILEKYSIVEKNKESVKLFLGL